MKQDPIIEAAERELRELEARRAEIEGFIVQYRSYLEKAAVAEPSAGYTLIRTPIAAPAVDYKKGASCDEVMSAVHDILSIRGDAMSLAALYENLARRGVRIGGKNPKQNLSQKLSAHPQLKSYGKRGWYFADKEPPSLDLPRRLSEDEKEKDPAGAWSGPSQMNGATGLPQYST